MNNFPLAVTGQLKKVAPTELALGYIKVSDGESNRYAVLTIEAEGHKRQLNEEGANHLIEMLAACDKVGAYTLLVLIRLAQKGKYS